MFTNYFLFLNRVYLCNAIQFEMENVIRLLYNLIEEKHSLKLFLTHDHILLL